MSTRHVVCRLADLASGEARRFEIGKHPVAVVRVDDRVFAIGDICSHQKISLSEGEVHCDSLELECWKHGSCFSLVDGQPHALPATKAVPVYGVEVIDGDVVVTL